MTNQIGIREAKIHLSKYLRMVKQGWEIIVTERGRPIGKIVPIGKNEIPLDDRIKKLEDSGILEPEKKKTKNTPPIPIKGNKTAQGYLLEDRGDR
ncbi:MAG: type II toxin-antitoxin system Phd/YefM family antitoxin [Desulfosarcina sp.]|nr:type II toxin-antitoxin system Phd/YefM family antitoxin [Desulfosarcina sp.]